jgi:2-hydroxychromene-2-carboxylate isomerase
MLLGGVFKATGNASPITIPAKGRYMFDDLARYARRYKVALTFSPHFPINTLVLMRAITGVQLHQPERFQDLLDCLFRALWAEGRHLGDPAVVATVLTEHQFDPEQILAFANDENVKAALKSNTEQAVQRGVFGAPSLFVGNQLFFGQDRLEFVREALS